MGDKAGDKIGRCDRARWAGGTGKRANRPGGGRDRQAVSRTNMDWYMAMVPVVSSHD